MKVKPNSNIRWSMSFAPVMACKNLKLEEKLLLNLIMSMKYSFDNVCATKEKVMELTGLDSDQFDSAVSSLHEKDMIMFRGKEWRIIPTSINKFLGVEVYDPVKYRDNGTDNNKVLKEPRTGGYMQNKQESQDIPNWQKHMDKVYR